jgi:hypothetical protein
MAGNSFRLLDIELDLIRLESNQQQIFTLFFPRIKTTLRTTQSYSAATVSGKLNPCKCVYNTYPSFHEHFNTSEDCDVMNFCDQIIIFPQSLIQKENFL